MMRVIHVARKPLSATVASNALKWGTGGLDIDAGRIGYVSEQDKTPTVGSGAGGLNPGCGPTLPSRKENWGEWRVNPTGRWPANVILVHFAGCQLVGTRRVAPTSTDGPGPVRRTGVHAEAGGHQTVGRQQPPVRGYADEDGLETVEAWDCVPGCPVLDLDEQVEHDDGISRFFKQVQS